jgi:hypothetical protein
MLFINAYTYDKEERDEIIKRRLEKGRMLPKGVKVVGEWTAVGHNMGFLVFEADDPKLVSEAVIAWSDILDSNVYLVLDTEKDLMGLLKKAAK